MTGVPIPDFLQRVAGSLVERFGADLSNVTVVFPGSRTGLFLNRYLYRELRSPLWAPKYRSIENLFESASELRKGDNIALVAELYAVYNKVYDRNHPSPSTETLDEFFFFGEILLNDFDDVDKNQVDARALFHNLRDLDALRDTFSHLSEDQREAIARHFHAFQGESSLKTAFWNVWNLLGDVYVEFKERLVEKKVAYTGMLMRSVVEDDAAVFPSAHYAFVGFNVLSKCEKALFQRLRSKASFYWDFDESYLHVEAGRFIRHNIQQFGSALDEVVAGTYQAVRKKITFLSCPSESGQSAVIAPWIESLGKDPSFTQPDTAIVLCNEAILPAVMHAIPPDKVENVNITMGFPLMQTAIVSFLQVLVEMQTKGYRASDESFAYRYVLAVLQHPYAAVVFDEAVEVAKELTENRVFYPTMVQLRSEILFSYAPDTIGLIQYLLEIVEQVGRHYEEAHVDTYSGLYQESVFRAYQVVNRLHGLVAEGDLKIEKLTFSRLLRKLLSTVQVPFHGEPVRGLQVMGVLETRALDFENLLILNVNEGYMPGGDSETTFIPQFLRIHFEMTTIEHQDSIYAYYFYRLIHRCMRVTLVYSTDQAQTARAEASRFLLQLLVESSSEEGAKRLEIERFTLQSGVQPWSPEPLQVEKDVGLLQELRDRYDLNVNPSAHRLSATALNTFIDCSYKFYLEYVRGLRGKEALVDELDPSIFGSIFHRAAEWLYREIEERYVAEAGTPFTVRFADLDDYRAHPQKVRRLVLKSFTKEYFKGRSVAEEDFNGEQLLAFQVICKMLERLILFDQKRSPYTLLGLEYHVRGEFSLSKRNIRLSVGGVIDRLEERDGKFYILDYKTGGRAKECKSLEELFVQKNDRASHIFQTFVYASALLQQTHLNGPIVPELLYIQQASKGDYSPRIRCNKQIVEDFRELQREFTRQLVEKIDELFDPSVPFVQTAIKKTCEYCDFREICGR